MLAATLAAVGVLVGSAGPPAFARTDPGSDLAPVTATRDAAAGMARQVATIDGLVAAASASADSAGRMGVLRFEQQALRAAAAAQALDA